MFFDTHAHLDSHYYNSDREALLEALPAAGVALVVDPGCDEESSRFALSLAERYPYIYAAVGVHPQELSGYCGSLDAIRAMAQHPKCVAIGEIGLDYYWDATHKREQEALFRAQIELALELCKPVIVHDREAHGDTLAIVLDYPALRGVFHCFSGSAEMAKELIKRGWYLGFDGPITYKNARKTLEALEACPLEQIVLETDSPYLTPVPYRGQRNDPGNLRYIAESAAAVKGIDPEEMARITLANGKRLFGLGETI